MTMAEIKIPAGIELGPYSGFYELPDGNPNKLWVPEGLQTYDARCLERTVFDTGETYDILVPLMKGGNKVVPLGYGLKIHKVMPIHMSNYDELDNELPEPVIISVPVTDELWKEHKESGRVFKILISDELKDRGKTQRKALEVVQEIFPFDFIDFAFLYDKAPPGQLDISSLVRKIHVVRSTHNRWLVHENQIPNKERDLRLVQLAPHRKKMQKTLGWLGMQPVDLTLVPRLIERAAAA